MLKFFSKHHQLLLILLIALCLRLYRINNPVLDWHSFRQADTASVTREYVKHGINLLEPKYHDLSNIQSGQDNLIGYRMVEFPILNALTAIIIKALPRVSEALLGRLVSVIFSLIALAAFYSLIKNVLGKKIALWSTTIMAVMPYSIFYSRVILPEPAMLAGILTSLWAFNRWLKTNRFTDYLTSLLTLAIALLLKPYVIFIAPLYLTLGIIQKGKKFFKSPLIYIYPLLALAPLYAWRDWITNYPAGIPANDWLFNSDGIRLRPAWFRWLFWERLTKLWLGFGGLVLMFGSLMKPFKIKQISILASWWAGCFAYMIIFATGNVRHDYYQVLLIPVVSLTLGLGIIKLQIWLNKRLGKSIAKILIRVCIAVSFVLAWNQVHGFFNVNHWEYQKAGLAVDKLTPPDALVIAPAMGDTQFLFQTNRRGWPIGFEIEEKIKLGATHYINTAQDDETTMLESKFNIIKKTPDYVLIDLTSPKK